MCLKKYQDDSPFALSYSAMTYQIVYYYSSYYLYLLHFEVMLIFTFLRLTTGEMGLVSSELGSGLGSKLNTGRYITSPTRLY